MLAATPAALQPQALALNHRPYTLTGTLTLNHRPCTLIPHPEPRKPEPGTRIPEIEMVQPATSNPTHESQDLKTEAENRKRETMREARPFVREE